MGVNVLLDLADVVEDPAICQPIELAIRASLDDPAVNKFLKPSANSSDPLSPLTFLRLDGGFTATSTAGPPSEPFFPLHLTDPCPTSTDAALGEGLDNAVVDEAADFRPRDHVFDLITAFRVDPHAGLTDFEEGCGKPLLVSKLQQVSPFC